MRPDDVLSPLLGDTASNKCFIKHGNQPTILENASKGLTAADQIVLKSFPVETIESIKQTITETQDCLIESVSSLQRRTGFQVSRVTSAVSHLANEVSDNLMAVFSVLATHSDLSDTHLLQKIARHATSVSTLGIIMSILRGDDDRTTSEIGLAGLLHDTSILFQPDWFVLNPVSRTETARKQFRSHSLASASLFEGLPGVSASVIKMIREVHEQFDGSGFPFGKSREELHSGSLILNLADAFISLISPILGPSIVASDAMAVLCHHTTRGAFSRDTFQIFLDSVSIYPVGTVVKLDDKSDAVVVNSNRKKPFQPVVRLLPHGVPEIDLSYSEFRVIELSHGGESTKSRRVSRASLGKALWRSELDIR
jgi:HD-GYP domain-containing protein (c-di-GMP phosphodiesterase class II)